MGENGHSAFVDYLAAVNKYQCEIMSPYCKFLHGEPTDIPSEQQNGCNVAERALTLPPDCTAPFGLFTSSE